MSIAVEVEQLSKLYRVDHTMNGGARRELRESATEWFRSAWHRLRHGAAHGLYAEDFWALKDVSFTINEGDVMGIVGRNGAGKSTLLKILSRITSPTSGRARIFGRVGSLLEVGTGFHEDLSGRENLFLNGAILGMPRSEIRSKFSEIVEFSGVERFIDTPVKRYSTGMRVRLGFAVAAFLEPEILIVDEVLAVGDVEFQRRCLGKMSSVAESGRTVVFVSHNLAAMQQLTNRCLMLDQGQLIADGPTENVIEQYLHTYAPANEGTITEAMHKITNGVRVQRIQLVDENGYPQAMPRNFSPLRYRTEFTVDRVLPDLIFTIGVDTLDGKSLVRLITPEQYFGSGPIPPGKYAVEVDFDLPIHAGTYSTFLRIDESQRMGMCIAEVSGGINFDLHESRGLGFEGTRKPYQQSLLPLKGKWRSPQIEPA